jgi:hypothetical protein
MAIVALAQGSIEAQTANGNVSQNPICAVQKDEIEVYVGFLKLRVIPQVPIVLVTTTEATDAHVDHFADMLHAVKGYATSGELREDFKSRNESSCTIGVFGGVKNLKFISEAELAGQREIQKRYGKDAVLIRFSRVGFDPSKSLAFIYVSVGLDDNARSGTLYLLKRNGGTWMITFKVEITISLGTAHP